VYEGMNACRCGNNVLEGYVRNSSLYSGCETDEGILMWIVSEAVVKICINIGEYQFTAVKGKVRKGGRNDRKRKEKTKV